MHVSFLRYEEIRTKIQVLLLSKLSSLCKHAWHIKFFPCCWSSVVNLNSPQFSATRMALLLKLQFFQSKIFLCMQASFGATSLRFNCTILIDVLNRKISFLLHCREAFCDEPNCAATYNRLQGVMWPLESS